MIDSLEEEFEQAVRVMHRNNRYTGCIKKSRQIRGRSLFPEAPQCTIFYN